MPAPSIRHARLWPMLGLGLLAAAPLHAQTMPDTTVDLSVIEQAVEDLVEDLDGSEADPAAVADAVGDLAAHPLDLNTATPRALARIPGLPLLTAYRIVAHRQEAGRFATVDALRAVEGVSAALLEQMRPFVYVAPPDGPAARSRRPLRARWTQRFIRRRTADEAALTAAHLGRPHQLYTRLQARPLPLLRLNLTMEKDAGEPFHWRPGRQAYGFDYVSAYAAVETDGPLQTLIVGDYVAGFGQGVVLWHGAGFGKGRDPVAPVVRAGAGLRPYGGADENHFLRGVAATGTHGPLTASLFASRRRLDANAGPGFVTALTPTGLHRTPDEQARKDVLGEQLLGAHLGIEHGAVAAGLIAYAARFDQPLLPGDRPDQRFLFRGDRLAMAGVHLRLHAGGGVLFGELARAPGGVFGGTGGLAWQWADRLEVVAALRHYPPAFTSLHGSTFGEYSGGTRNETGFYAGVRLHPARRWSVSAYVDQYRFPWLRYGLSRPSAGQEARLVLEHRPRRWLTAYVQFRTETQERPGHITTPDGAVLAGLTPATRRSLRLHGTFQFSPRLRLQARLERTRFTLPHAPARTGFLLYQDLRWHPTRRLRLDGRLAFFDAPHFEARLYAYEHDLDATFSVPALQGRGHRTYLLLHLHAAAGLVVQMKYALTYEAAYTPAAADRYTRPVVRELRTQLQWRF